MTIERISIEWRPVAGIPGTGHLYLIAREAGQTNAQGSVISAGPTIPHSFPENLYPWVDYGLIEVNEGAGAGGEIGNENNQLTIDFYTIGEDTELSRGARDIQAELLAANPSMSLDAIWAGMIAKANDIHAQQISYDPTDGLPPVGVGVNSNSTIVSLLASFNVNFENVLPNQSGLEDTPVTSGLFPGQNTLIATSGDDDLNGYGGNDLFYVASGGTDIFHGGDGVNKTFFNALDGLDKVKFARAEEAQVNFTDFGGGETGWTYTQIINSNVSTGTLYSIERFSGAYVDLLNKIDLSAYTTGVTFEDRSAAQIQSDQQTIDPNITSSLNIKMNPTTYVVADNFGHFIGTDYNDTFSLNAVLGRRFDGGGGTYNQLSYANLIDPRGLKIDAGLGTVLVRGTDEFAGPGAPVNDIFENMKTVEGSRFGDEFRGSGGADMLYGNAGDDEFESSEGADQIWGGAGYDTVNYSLDAASGGTGAVQVMMGVNSYVGVVDGFGDADQLRDVESLILTGGNDSVTYDGYNEFSIRHIDGGAGSDTYTNKGGFLPYVQQDGDIWRFFNAANNELTLENFETVRFSAAAGYFATLLPDMQDSTTPVNRMTSDTGGTTLIYNVDYSAASGNGTYSFGVSGQDDNSVSIGSVSQVLRSPMAVYASNQSNTVDIAYGSSLYQLYTGTGPRDFCGGARVRAHRPKFTRPKPQGSHHTDSNLNSFMRGSACPHDSLAANDNKHSGCLLEMKKAA